jgi:3-methyladenine DNA glycosylase AlkD
MPFHGVATPLFRKTLKPILAGFPITTAGAWRSECLAIWRGARFREERHAAIELSGVRGARPFQTMDALPMYEELIVDGAWWDIVDALATHRLHGLLVRHPREMRKAMLAWSHCDDVWKRRSSILCQVRAKADTDLDLLYRCIEPSLARKEFWLRKAIGWALRSYAWTDPREVERFVRAHEAQLSPLSKKEALKNVGATRRAAGRR